jgi:hypothetical protein
MCTVRELLLGDDDDDADEDARFLCFLLLPGELDDAAAGEPEGEARDDDTVREVGLADKKGACEQQQTQSYSLWLLEQTVLHL